MFFVSPIRARKNMWQIISLFPYMENYIYLYPYDIQTRQLLYVSAICNKYSLPFTKQKRRLDYIKKRF